MVFVVSVIKLYFCRKYCNLKISELLKKVIYPCLIVSAFTLVMGFLPSLFFEESLVRLLFCFTLSTIALICSSILFASSTEERQLFKNLINKYNKK
jgi:hypothetical protein